MNNILAKSWFNVRPRTNLSSFLEKELNDVIAHMTTYSLYDQGDKDVLYKCSVLAGLLTSLMMIKYTCVDLTTSKPWIARHPIKQILDLKDFKAYSDDVVKWLTRQPPSSNYSKLVYVSTIINFLTTMEFKDA